MPSHEPPSTSSRREILRQGKKLAYTAPIVIAALQVESAFAASGGPPNGNNKDKDKDKDKNKK